MKSLIFDIDGTLWDSRAIVAKGYNDYLIEIGRPDRKSTRLNSSHRT